MQTELIKGATRGRQLGFTLVEMMVTVAIFSLVVTGMIYAHIFGLKLNQIAESKIGANDDSRNSLGELASNVRTAKYHEIGNFNNGAFEGLPNGMLQSGNAIRLTLTTNLNTTITYYFETNTPGNFKLCRKRSDSIATDVMASHLTNNFANSLIFTLEDHRGNVITDLSNRRIIHFILDFCQYQYPLTTVGPGALYDRYKMEFRLTPHVPEGR